MNVALFDTISKTIRKKKKKKSSTKFVDIFFILIYLSLTSVPKEEMKLNNRVQKQISIEKYAYTETCQRCYSKTKSPHVSRASSLGVTIKHPANIWYIFACVCFYTKVSMHITLYIF